jgi:hypothetical protein
MEGIIKTPHKADATDLSGTYFLYQEWGMIVQEAVHGSIRANITNLIESLSAKTEAELTAKGT